MSGEILLQRARYIALLLVRDDVIAVKARHLHARLRPAGDLVAAPSREERAGHPFAPERQQHPDRLAA